MKTLYFLAIFTWATQAAMATELAMVPPCPDKAEITAPIANKTYPVGSNLNIIVKSTQCALINNAALYFNGQYITKKHGPNASWSHHHFRFLRKMQAGTYHVKIRVQEFHGQTYELEMSFKVSGVTIMAAKDFGYCVFTNPLKNLTWLRNMHRKNPNLRIQEYRQNFVGRHRSAFAIRKCGSYQVVWYDCSGKIIGRGSNSRALRGLKFRKTWNSGCRS